MARVRDTRLRLGFLGRETGVQNRGMAGVVEAKQRVLVPKRRTDGGELLNLLNGSGLSRVTN